MENKKWEKAFYLLPPILGFTLSAGKEYYQLRCKYS